MPIDPSWQRLADDLVRGGELSRIAADVLIAESELTGVPFPTLVARHGTPSAVPAPPTRSFTDTADAGGWGVPASAPTPPATVLTASARPSQSSGRPGAIQGLAGDELSDLVRTVAAAGGSDLHLTAGSPPMMRVRGGLVPVSGTERLDTDRITQVLRSSLPAALMAEFDATNELDTSLAVPGLGRVRCNVYRQRGSVGAALRLIPATVPELHVLGLPPVVQTLAELPRGLVLVTGPTGSGKSTTLASIIDLINRTKRLHIMSCEDPIEFVHSHKLSIVNQREVGVDTSSFAEALRRVLRQDPDVILVGEMRDLETIHIALTAAETGHLVLATLHTQSAPTTIDRVIDVFPAGQQSQVRAMLASTLQAVVTQQLVPTRDGRGRVPAVEVLIGTPAVRALIRENKVHQLGQAMQTGGSRHGMVTMDASLAALVRAGVVSPEVALERAGNPDELRTQLGGVA